MMNVSSNLLRRSSKLEGSNASGSIFLGIDANCNIDDSGDQRGVLVRELCALHNLLPLFQRFWTLAWQSPTGATWKKKVDFCRA